MTWAALVLSGLVGMAEASAVVQEATPTGQYPATALFGLGQVTSPASPPYGVLEAWAQATGQFRGLWAWLCVYLAFSLLSLAGWWLLGHVVLSGETDGETDGRRLLNMVALVVLAQDALALMAFLVWVRPGKENVPGVVVWPLDVVVIVKWAAILALLARLAYWAWSDNSVNGVHAHASRIARALKKQRFSAVVVVLLAVLAASRGSDVLEQMPDVERAWLTGHPSLGWVHLAAAAAAQMMLAFWLLYLGRLRVWRARASFTGGSAYRPDRRRYMTWLLIPVIVLAGAGVLRWVGWAAVSWLQVAAIPLVMWGVVIASLLVDRFRPGQARSAGPGRELPGGDPKAQGGDTEGPADAAPERTANSPGENAELLVKATRTAGDLLAVGVVAVAGLGLVRAFTAPALVVGSRYAVVSGVAAAAGVAVAVGCWPTAYWLRATAATRATKRETARQGKKQDAADSANQQDAAGPAKERETEGAAGGWHPVTELADWARFGLPPWSMVNPSTGKAMDGAPWWTAAAAAPFLAADVLLIFIPLWTTHWLGALATTVTAFGTLAVGLALLAYHAQSSRPLPAFQLLRLKATPVITVVVLIAVAGAELDTNSTLHNIRAPASSSSSSSSAIGLRQDLQASLREWLASPATTACAVPPPPGSTAAGEPPVRVEPLVLVAAAGGGIRAAWWTEHVLSAIAATPCGRHAVFAVSSVSGSSVGLAVMTTTSQPDAAIARIAGPDALAAALDGLLLRDMIAGVAGLDLTAAQMPPGQRYPDRAALMESAWTAEDHALAQPFPLTRPVLPWAMLLNSTAVRTGCRAIIADRPLPPAVPYAQPTLTCLPGSAAPAADSYDFLAALPCLNRLDTVTAAMLSARFPFVTPAGRVSACGQPTEQYVDGGYADSTGLSTLADLTPALVTTIRAYNTAAVTNAQPGRPVTIVVPLTVYIGNSAQPEPIPGAVPASPPEPLIPIASTASSANSQLIGSTPILQRLAAEIAPSQLFSCATASPQCALAQAAAAASVPRQLILIVPRTYPRVAAPLGWVLSTASRDALTTALVEESRGICGPRPGSRQYCPAGIGRFGDLIQLISER